MSDAATAAKPPKAPQDHKPKGKKGKGEKPKKAKPVVTRTAAGFEIEHRGITVTIDLDAMNDFELIRDLGRMQHSVEAEQDARAMTAIPSVFDRFFGKAQGQRVLDGLRNPETKRVRVEDATSFLFEIFGALNPES